MQEIQPEEKRRWPALEALEVAHALRRALAPVCEQIEIAGSLRRRALLVGDIELLYVPRWERRAAAAADLLGHQPQVNVSLADELLRGLEREGVLARRRSRDGRECFGPLNKLMVHAPSGIPVDLFATDRLCWWNSLVCRTGGAQTNRMIARSALARGYHWNTNGAGFTPIDPRGKAVVVRSEGDVFATVGLPWLDPWERA